MSEVIFRLIHGRRRFKSFRSDQTSVAQAAERRAYNAEVAGSLPAAGTTSICSVEVCAPARKPGGAGAIPAGWTTEEQADWRRHPARTRASASLGRSTRPSSANSLARRRPPRRPRRTGREAHTLRASRLYGVMSLSSSPHSAPHNPKSPTSHSRQSVVRTSPGLATHHWPRACNYSPH